MTSLCGYSLPFEITKEIKSPKIIASQFPKLQAASSILAGDASPIKSQYTPASKNSLLIFHSISFNFPDFHKTTRGKQGEKKSSDRAGPSP